MGNLWDILGQKRNIHPSVIPSIHLSNFSVSVSISVVFPISLSVFPPPLSFSLPPSPSSHFFFLHLLVESSSRLKLSSQICRLIEDLQSSRENQDGALFWTHFVVKHVYSWPPAYSAWKSFQRYLDYISAHIFSLCLFFCKNEFLWQKNSVEGCISLPMRLFIIQLYVIPPYGLFLESTR